MHDTIIRNVPNQFLINSSNIPTVLLDELNTSAVDTIWEEETANYYSQRELSPSTKDDIQELKEYMDGMASKENSLEREKIYRSDRNEESDTSNDNIGKEEIEKSDGNSEYEERKKNNISSRDEERDKNNKSGGNEEREVNYNSSKNGEREVNNDIGYEESEPKTREKNEQGNPFQKNGPSELKNSHCNAVDIANNATENKYTDKQRSGLECSKGTEMANGKQLTKQLDRDDKNRSNCSDYISCLFLVCILFVFLFMLFYPYDPLCQLILIAYLMYRVKL